MTATAALFGDVPTRDARFDVKESGGRWPTSRTITLTSVTSSCFGS